MKNKIFKVLVMVLVISIFVGDSCKALEEKKVVYLTFDDGPSVNTEKVLKILKENDVKATFFVVESLREKDAIYVKQAYDEGNAIGNHTYDHDFDKVYVSEDVFWKSYNKDQKFIKEITGEESLLFRFPGGSFNHDVQRRNGKEFNKRIIKKLEEKQVRYFDWDIDSGDGKSDNCSATSIYNNIVKGIKDKSKVIILMHDSKGKKSTVEALPSIIKVLKEKGYEFATLREY